MIKRMLIILFSLSMIANSLQGGVWDSISNFFKRSSSSNNDILKILIVHNKPGVVLEVKGKYKIYDPKTNSHLGKGYTGGKRRYIQPLSDGIKWGEEFPGVFQVTVMPDDKSTTFIVDGIEYKGRICVYDIGGSISIVNEITFDEYVKTVLSSKLQQPLPPEALAALVIAARTNAYYMMQNSRSNYWNVEAKQIAYQGYALSNPNNVLDQAVKATHDMVMLVASNPFLAQWGIVEAGRLSNASPIDSKISLDQASMFAHQGENAAQILKKAFPNAQLDKIE